MRDHCACRIKSVLQFGGVFRGAPHTNKHLGFLTLARCFCCCLRDLLFQRHEVSNHKRDEIGRHFDGRGEFVQQKRGTDGLRVDGRAADVVHVAENCEASGCSDGDLKECVEKR